MNAAATEPDLLETLLAIMAEDADVVAAEPAVAPADVFFCKKCRTRHCALKYTDAGRVLRSGRAYPDTHYGVCFFCDGGVREVQLCKVIPG